MSSSTGQYSVFSSFLVQARIRRAIEAFGAKCVNSRRRGKTLSDCFWWNQTRLIQKAKSHQNDSVSCHLPISLSFPALGILSSRAVHTHGRSRQMAAWRPYICSTHTQATSMLIGRTNSHLSVLDMFADRTNPMDIAAETGYRRVDAAIAWTTSRAQRDAQKKPRWQSLLTFTYGKCLYKLWFQDSEIE